MTIVLTTTRAVSATILDAAARMPVRAGSWAQRLAPDVAVVVADAAVIVRNRAQFVALIRGLDAQGRLGRVVIDEVHLLGLWGSFRHLLVFVKDVLATLPCPLILLTATAPVRWVQPLLAATGWTPPALWQFYDLRQRGGPTCATVLSRLRCPLESVAEGRLRRPMRYRPSTWPLLTASSSR